MDTGVTEITQKRAGKNSARSRVKQIKSIEDSTKTLRSKKYGGGSPCRKKPKRVKTLKSGAGEKTGGASQPDFQQRGEKNNEHSKQSWFKGGFD